MAVFNNGSITATVTPPQGYSGSYSYELFKYDNGSWVTVTAAAEGYNAGLFINPISTSATTYTFGNPDGFDDNIEGSGTWRGLKPAQYKVVVTTLTGLTCEVEGTATVGSDDPTDPCYGFNISASVDSDTAITVTVVGGTASFIWTLNGSGAAAFDNLDGTFTFNNLTPSTFYTIGVVDANSCTDSVTATTTGTADPEFTCTDANFQVTDGTTGQDVVATVAAGTLNSVSPAQYVDGSATYTANITVPATGYSNSGATLTTCTDTATGSTTLPEFTCTNANFQVTDGTTGQDVVATVAAGTLNSVSPAQYVDGSATYTANITVPATGYSNSGATLTTCTDTATGTSGGGNNIIYYFHGFDDLNQEPWATESGTFDFADQGFCEPNGDYYLANTIGGGQSNFNATPRTLDDVMAHLINNVTVGNYSIITEDTGGSIIAAGNAGATVLNFPATPGVDAQYYFAVPQSLTSTNYTSSGSVNLTNQPDGTSALAGQAADRKAFSYDGADYWLYRMSTASQGQNYLGFNS